MKKLLLMGMLMVMLAIPSFGQSATSVVSRFNTAESGGIYKVEATFTSDSLAASLYTTPFSVLKYDVVYTTTPVLFHIKQVGTSGKPNCLYTLQGFFNSTWIDIDTLRASSAVQSETDTIGTMTLNGKFAPSYRVQIKNAAASDINSGVLGLYFPIKQRNYR